VIEGLIRELIEQALRELDATRRGIKGALAADDVETAASFVDLQAGPIAGLADLAGCTVRTAHQASRGGQVSRKAHQEEKLARNAVIRSAWAATSSDNTKSVRAASVIRQLRKLGGGAHGGADLSVKQVIRIAGGK